jgi:Zn-dependent protease with chaperone function
VFRYSLTFLLFLAAATSKYFVCLGSIDFDQPKTLAIMPWLLAWILLFPATFWLMYGGAIAFCTKQDIPIEKRRRIYLSAITFTVPIAAVIQLIFAYWLAVSGMLKRFIFVVSDPAASLWVSFAPLIGLLFIVGIFKIALRVEGKLFAPDLPPISLKLTGEEKSYRQTNVRTRMAVTFLLMGCFIYFVPRILEDNPMEKNGALLAGVIFALGVWLTGDKARKSGKRFGLGLPNEELTNRAKVLAEIIGTKAKPVLVREGLFADHMVTGKAARRAISITKGSVEKLTYEQMEFLLAHELAHYRQSYANKAAAISGGFVVLSLAAFFGYSDSAFANDNPETIFLLIVLVVLLNMVFTRGLRLWGRGREFEADKIAAIATRNPRAGVECLSMCRSTSPRPFIHDYYVAMYPPMEQRLDALRAMTPPQVGVIA